MIFAATITVILITPFILFGGYDERHQTRFLLSLTVAILGQFLVTWMGRITNHCFEIHAPEESALDNTLGPLPDGTFRCHKLANTGIVPRWVSSILIMGFLLRISGSFVVIITSGVLIFGWING
jgi:hypothetical protein